MLLVAAVVASMKAVEVGEHSQSFGNTALVEDAHPHRAPVFPCIGEIELSAFHVLGEDPGDELGHDAPSPCVGRPRLRLRYRGQEGSMAPA